MWSSPFSEPGQLGGEYDRSSAHWRLLVSVLIFNLFNYHLVRSCIAPHHQAVVFWGALEAICSEEVSHNDSIECLRRC